MCSAVGHGSASTPASSAGLQSGDGHHHRSTTSFLTKRTSSSSLLLTLIAAAPPAETAISAWIPPRSEWTGTMMVSAWMEAYIFVSARPQGQRCPAAGLRRQRRGHPVIFPHSPGGAAQRLLPFPFPQLPLATSPVSAVSPCSYPPILKNRPGSFCSPLTGVTDNPGDNAVSITLHVGLIDFSSQEIASDAV